MAANVIDSLIISLGLDPSGVKKGVSDADAVIGKGAKKMSLTLADAAKGIGKFLAPVLGAAAIKSAIDDYVGQADRLGDVAESLNMSGKELDTWGKAAQVAGGSAEGLEGSLRTMGTQIQNAVTFGMKKSQKVFDELGVSLKDFEGKTKTSTQVLTDLAAVADTMGKEEFASIAKKLGLDDGTIMLLQRGKAGLAELLGEMKGYALTDEEIAAAGEYDEKMNRLSFSIKSVSNMFLSAMIPALDFVAKNLTKLFGFLRKHKAFTYAFFGGLGAIILKACIPALYSMATAAWAAMAPFLPFIAIVAAIALVIDDFVTYANGGESALGGFWEKLIGSPKEALEFLNSLVGIFGAIGDIIKADIERLNEFGKTLGDALADFAEFINLRDKQLNEDFDAMNAAETPEERGRLAKAGMENLKKSREEEERFIQKGGAVNVWQGGQGMGAMAGASAAVAPSTMFQATPNITNESKTDIQSNLTVTVTEASPAAVGQWKAEQDNQALVRNYNSGVNQGGAR